MPVAAKSERARETGSRAPVDSERMSGSARVWVKWAARGRSGEWAEMVLAGPGRFFSPFLFIFLLFLLFSCFLFFFKSKLQSKFNFVALYILANPINCDEVILMLILFVLNNIPFPSLFSRIFFRF